MTTSDTIPLIDFSKCGLLLPEDGVTEQDLKDTGDVLYNALSTIGFAYLTNHGIGWSLVDELHEVVERFYSLPLEVKMRYQQKGLVLTYDYLGRAKANFKDYDHYEGYRVSGEAYTDESIRWPDVPGFKDCYFRFSDISSKLFKRIMKALGYGMKLKDREYFCRVHSLMNQKGNFSILKVNKYPPINDDDKTTENRLGEHSDRSTLTLLYQDKVGGLQVRDVNGEWMDVHPIPGAIIINVGDTLAAWSKNKLKATKHRVNTPSNPENRGLIRRSAIYFAQANDEAVMSKLQFEDDSDDIESDENPLTVKEYTINSLRGVYEGF